MLECFKERLNEAIRLSAKQQKDIARECQISDVRLSAYVRGKNEPPAEVLVTLCTVLGVSPNYLLGFEEYSAYNPLLIKIRREHSILDDLSPMERDQAEAYIEWLISRRDTSQKGDTGSC